MQKFTELKEEHKKLKEKFKKQEAENSEMKAAQLMSSMMKPSNSGNSDKAMMLQVQLSEKTNEILRLKEEIEDLRKEKEQNPFVEVNSSGIATSADPGRVSSLTNISHSILEPTLGGAA